MELRAGFRDSWRQFAEQCGAGFELMDKRTITIKELDNGKLRITVDGPPYIVRGSNLSSPLNPPL